MRILVLTQNENIYLPRSLDKICSALESELCAIVTAPAMSTHGGAFKGLIKHIQLFGLKGTGIMSGRVLLNKLLALWERGNRSKAFHSIQGIAKAHAVPYFHVQKINSQEFHNLLDQLRPDLLISLSCPQVIGKRLRGRFPYGAINVHGAPLPRYRGLMPAFWALLNNEQKTAVTVHDLDDQLDNGEILVQQEVPISVEDTWDSLVKKTKAAGAEALIRAVEHIKTGTVERRPNREEEATYFTFPTTKDRKAFLAAGRRFF